MNNLVNDLITIITPTYNRSSLLKKTIISVLNQTYKNFEHLIIDDGSTDDTREIVESFKDKRIKYFLQKHTGIPAAGRNTGIKIAKGRYIAFLDHDDLWFPQKLEKQIKEFKQNRDLLVVASNGIYIPEKPYRRLLPLKSNAIISFEDLFKNNPIMNSSALVKKEVFEEIGLLDDRIGNYLPDYDFWLRVLNYKNNSILTMKDILIKYRIHESNITLNLYRNPLFLKEKYKRLIHIYKKNNVYDKRSLQPLLITTLKQYRIANLRQLLYFKKIKISEALNYPDINLVVKAGILIEHYYSKLFKKKNQFINRFEYYIKKLLKNFI